MAKMLYGKDVSVKIKEDLANKISSLEHKPCLSIVMVGSNHASEIYVKNKISACREIGIRDRLILLSEKISEKDLLKEIEEQNADKNVNGIIVQLPLPEHINVNSVINAIAPEKDVDCFSPINVGKMFTGESKIAPCTPMGVVEILKYYDIPIAGKNCVILGRSDIVGKPMSILMLRENATVTVCHSKTENIYNYISKADILISAIGKREFITPGILKDGAVVIDVGINRDYNGKVCGDVSKSVYDMDNISVTPVPGGVGPMTVTMLLKNTYEAYIIQNNI